MSGGQAVGLAAFFGALVGLLIGYFVFIGAARRDGQSDAWVGALIRKQLLWCASGGAVVGVVLELVFMTD